MTITEGSRHELYKRLEQVLGREEATVLMEHLPPVGWADVATKRDLDALSDRLDGRFGAIDVRFEGIDIRFDALSDRVDSRLDALSDRFDARFERELRALEHRFLTRSILVLGAFFTLQTAVFELLG